MSGAIVPTTFQSGGPDRYARIDKYGNLEAVNFSPGTVFFVNDIAVNATSQTAVATGTNSIAIGYQSNSAGAFGIAIGAQASVPVAATNGIAIGQGAQATGVQAIAIGAFAVSSSNTCTSIGFQASPTISGSSQGCVSIGYQAAFNTTTGSNSVAIGSTAHYWNSTNGSTVAVGFGALGFNSDTTVQNFPGPTTTGSNVAVGQNSQLLMYNGTQNVSVGTSSLRGTNYSIVTPNQCGGSGNTAVGNESMNNNYLCNNNTALGQDSLKYAGSPTSNTAVGYQAMYFNNVQAAYTLSNLTTSAPTQNVAVGQFAMSPNSAATIGAPQGNTCIGYASGQNTLATGTFNTLLGSNTNVSNDPATFRTAIGSGMVNSFDNSVVIGGNTTQYLLAAAGGISCPAAQQGGFYYSQPASTLTNPSNITLTAAQCSPGLLLVVTLNASRTFTLPTANQLVAAYPFMGQVGSCFYFTIRNETGASFAITLAASTSISLGTGTTSVAISTAVVWKVTCNASTPTCVCQRVGSNPV
jgi:hypothetical protein